MNNTSPFSFLETIAARLQPPSWVVDEGQQRLVLFLNHVLLQEKQAQERLLRQKGRVVHVRWGLFAIDLVITPAGLADRAPALSKPDLVLSVAAESPVAAVQAVLAGKTPPVKIEGDVQLAADIGWLAENLRWDAEEDLSRLIGDAPAHALATAGRRLALSLKQFLASSPLPPQPAAAPAGSADFVVPATPGERGTAPVAPGFQTPYSGPVHGTRSDMPASSSGESALAEPTPPAESQNDAPPSAVLPVPPGAAA